MSLINAGDTMTVEWTQQALTIGRAQLRTLEEQAIADLLACRESDARATVERIEPGQQGWLNFLTRFALRFEARQCVAAPDTRPWTTVHAVLTREFETAFTVLGDAYQRQGHDARPQYDAALRAWVTLAGFQHAAFMATDDARFASTTLPRSPEDDPRFTILALDRRVLESPAPMADAKRWQHLLT
jgi:hypothetical protein